MLAFLKTGSFAKSEVFQAPSAVLVTEPATCATHAPITGFSNGGRCQGSAGQGRAMLLSQGMSCLGGKKG